jgi:TonB-dependent receptor
MSFYKKNINSGGVVMQLIKIQSLMIFLFLFGFTFSLHGQNGKIVGKVTDAGTGDNLPGANVFLEGTNFGTATDRFGEYSITNIPPGTYSLLVRYIGYETDTSEISVSGNYTVEQNISLIPSAYEMDEVLVSGLLQGQVKALNQQLNSREIKNVLSRDEMEKFPDINTAEALQRIPGISISRDQGEGRFVFIRGTEPRLTGVTVDGQKLAASEQENRVTDLGIINASQLASIEVTKTLTPDMDAHGIGGQVNLVTKSAFDFEKPTLIIDAGGGYAEQGENPLYRTALSYIGFLGDNNQIGYTINGNFYQNNINGQRIDIGYDNYTRAVTRQFIEFGLDGVNLENRRSIRNRYGISGAFEYKPEKNQSYFLRGMYNLEKEDQTLSQMYYRLSDGRHFPIKWEQISGDTIRVDSLSVQSSRMDYSMINEQTNATLISAALGGENKWDLIGIDYYFHYSLGEQVREDPDRIRSEWAINKRPSFIIDLTGEFPLIEEVGDENIIYNAANYSADSHEWKRFTTSNTNYTGAFNINMNYGLFGYIGELTSGLKYTVDKKDRTGVTERFKWLGPDKPTMDMVSSGETIKDFLNGNFFFSPMIDLDKATQLLLDTQYPMPGEPGFIADMGGSGVVVDGDGVGGIYENTENIYSFYLMSTINFGDLMLLAGARDEYTNTIYEGKELLFNPQGDVSDIRPSRVETNYNNIFPYLHLRYTPFDRTNIRAALTQAIARPNYYDLAPYYFLIPDENELIEGNPELEPTLSTNIDLMFEHYFQGIGVASIGLFYKNLEKFIYERNWTQVGGQFDGFDRRKPVNAGSSELYGIEINWQQQFSFLPGFLNGFGIYANYTYTKSEADLEFRDRSVIPGQAGDVGNVGLNFEKYGLTARISANYRSEVLTGVGDLPKFDNYSDESLRIDFTSIYNIFRNFSVYVNIRNITNENDRSYLGIKSRATEIEYYGVSIDGGLKITL